MDVKIKYGETYKNSNIANNSFNTVRNVHFGKHQCPIRSYILNAAAHKNVKLKIKIIQKQQNLRTTISLSKIF